MREEFKTFEEAEALAIELFNESKYVIDIINLPEEMGYAVQWEEQKSYTAHDGTVWPDEVWRTRDGRLLQVQDIEPGHCRNIIRMMIREDREQCSQLEVLLGRVQQAMAGLHAGQDEVVDWPNTPDEKPVIH